jgi:hypothetical protein
MFVSIKGIVEMSARLAVFVQPGFHFNVISHLSKRIMTQRIIREGREEVVSVIG